MSFWRAPRSLLSAASGVISLEGVLMGAFRYYVCRSGDTRGRLLGVGPRYYKGWSTTSAASLGGALAASASGYDLLAGLG